jgi:polar amino acid transport system substrate-binding protein
MEQLADPSAFPRAMTRPASPRWRLRVAALVLASLQIGSSSVADTLKRAQERGRLVYGTDAEGGAPYIYPDPADSSRTIGFEFDLMGALALRMGLGAEPDQENWDRLLGVLGAGRVDVVCNGFELTDERQSQYLATRPYFVYQLQLVGKRGGSLRSWDDFRKPGPRGRPWRVAVLTNSVADRYVHEMSDFYKRLAGDRLTIEPVRRDSVVDALRETQTGQVDATVQDDLAARFQLRQAHYGDLRAVGPPQAGGYYVMYVRRGDETLRDALDTGIKGLIETGELRRIYERYGLWSPSQEELGTWDAARSENLAAEPGALAVLRSNRQFLIDATVMTIVLAFASMPLAMLIGLVVALGRMYGPVPVRWLMTTYVELIRGTPLMLQLYAIYIVLPAADAYLPTALQGWLVLPPILAGILGLAVNYSAYEAEIYRTGLQAVPQGQTEAARALGMSHGCALRRVILPQALRIVIPPITSDFITLLKDSSVCSVIGLVELSKQYQISANNTGQSVLFAAVVSAIYLAMSLPLSRLAHVLEGRLNAGLNPGRAA